MVYNTVAQWTMTSTLHNAKFDTLQAATRLLPCVGISCLQTVGQAETCELQLEKCIIGGQNHVIISDITYCRQCTHFGSSCH